MQLNIPGMKSRFAAFGDFMDKIWKDGGTTGLAMIDSYSKAWTDMVTGIRGKTPKEMFGPPLPPSEIAIPSFPGIEEYATAKKLAKDTSEEVAKAWKDSIDSIVSAYKELLGSQFESEQYRQQFFDFNFQFVKHAGWTEEQLWDFLAQQHDPDHILAFFEAHLGEDYYQQTPFRVFRVPFLNPK
jgi:hypothetical protein